MHGIPIFQKASFMEEFRLELISRYWRGVEKVFGRGIPKGYNLLDRGLCLYGGYLFLCISESLEFGIYLSIGT